MTTPRMSEADLLRSVIDLAELLGLRVHHSRPARTAQGWRTPISGHKGLPDLVIVGAGGVLWRELKSATGRVTPDQAVWLDALQAAGADAAVWRTEEWPDHIQDEMEAIRRPARGSVRIHRAEAEVERLRATLARVEALAGGRASTDHRRPDAVESDGHFAVLLDDLRAALAGREADL